MWWSSSAASVASLLILTLPCVYAAPASCNANPSVASCLSSGTSGTAYCSSVLKVPASTTYTTSTVTPTSSTVYRTRTLNPATTTTVTSTSTVHVLASPSTTTSTIVETAVEHSTTTTTVTSSCLSTGISQTVTFVKRQTASNSCFPSGYPSSSISSACACLSIPTSTSTVSRTVTAVRGTVYSDTFTRITSTSTNTKYTTVTDTPIITVPTTTTTTTTSVETATATSLLPNGVYVRKYSIDFDESSYRPNFPSDDLKAKTPEFSDTLSDPDFYTESGYLNFPKQGQVNLYQSALVMQGYFIVPTTGTYTFTTDKYDVDNWQVFWIGDVAKQWLNSQKNYDASRTTNDGNNWTGGSFSLSLVAGDAIPVTIITANANGPAWSPVDWTGPDGTTHYELRNNMIQSCGAF